MKIGLLVSLMLHGGLLAWAVVSIGQTEPKSPPTPKPIVVDISNIADLTRQKQGDAEKKPEKKAEKKPPVKAKPKPKPPAPQKTAALPPPKAEPPQPKSDPIKDLLKKAPEPKPKPKPAAKPKPVPQKVEKPKPKKVAKPKPKKAEPKPSKPKVAPKPAKAKPKPKKVTRKTRKKSTRKTPKNFDADDLSTLLDLDPTKKAGPKPKTVARRKPSAPVEADQGAPDGIGDKLTVSEFDFFIRQIGNCFAIPAGAKNAERYRPVVAFRLRRDGTVDGIPQVVRPGASPFFQIAAEASVRAVLECQPYRLPVEKYDDWKKNTITFDLEAMLRR